MADQPAPARPAAHQPAAHQPAARHCCAATNVLKDQTAPHALQSTSCANQGSQQRDKCAKVMKKHKNDVKAHERVVKT